MSVPRPDERALDVWDGEPTVRLAARWGAPDLRVLGSTASTNDVARAWSNRGGAAWSVVLAERQTAGRGRDRKAWSSTPGASIAMSVLVPTLGPDDALPLRVGLAVAEAIESVAPTLQPTLKWPNDVLLSGRKVAGILCEAAGASVVVGVGVNVGQRAEDFSSLPAGAATSLALSLPPPTPAPSRAEVVGAFLSRLRAQWGGASDGWREGWEARDALAGRRVTCTHGPEGVAVGFDTRGALLVRTPSARVVPVVSGSVRTVEDPATNVRPV